MGTVKCDDRVDDGLFAFQWRRLKTGFLWVIFGLGGLALTFTVFPWVRLAHADPERRALAARRWIQRTFRGFMWLARTLNVADLDASAVRGLQGVKGAIIVANHPTILDYVMIASELPEMDCVVKADLKKNPFLRGPVLSADYLFNDAAEAILDEVQGRLKKGHNILIFPEGTRTVPGSPLKLQRGVAHLALRLNCPIEVLHIQASDRWLDKSSQWYEIPKRRPSITIGRGPRLVPADYVRDTDSGYSLSSRRLTRALTEQLQTQP